MSQTEKQLPPHSVDAEAAVLGALLIDPDAFIEIADLLTEKDFFSSANRTIFEKIGGMNEKLLHVDFVSLAGHLPKEASPSDDGWLPYLMDLAASVPTSLGIREYAGIVAEKSKRRRMIGAAHKIVNDAFNDEETAADELLDNAERLIFDVRGDVAQTVSKPKGYTSDYMSRFLESRQAERELSGQSTGFADLDRMLNGLQAPHQYVLAARPGMGKSALAVNIADYATLKLGKRVAFFSLEMSEHQLMNRRVSAMTRIDSRQLQRPWELSEGQEKQVLAAVGAMSDAQLFIDASESQTPAQIKAKAMRLYAQHGLDLIIIDHLHRVKPDRRLARPDLEVGETSWAFANLGKALNVPVLTLAQLSRGVESRQVKRPQLADLRESGGIEENAFAVMFLYREGYYDEFAESSAAELIIAKHREGPTGTVPLFWKPETVSFHNSRKVDL